MNKDATTGKFVAGGGGGPGRGIHKALDRYKRESTDECLKALANDVENIGVEIAGVDTALAAAEVEYLSAIDPLLRQKARLEVDFSRAKTARIALLDRHAFAGFKSSPLQAARMKHEEAVAELRKAEAEAAKWPQPDFNRTEALISADRWEALHNYETARDRLHAAQVAERSARLEYEKLRSVNTGPSTLVGVETPARWVNGPLVGDGRVASVDRHKELVGN
jgi:hypothetical protein